MNRTQATELLSAAFKLDRIAREAEAIPLYRRAIRAGLKGQSLHDALVCLGSSLITVGNAKEAVRPLELARKKFPSSVAAILFLALAHHHSGKSGHALRIVGEQLIVRCDAKSLAGFAPVLLRKYRSLR